MTKFTFIDLFAGIGGFRIGLQHAGGECIGFSEIAQDAIYAYTENFKEDSSKNFGDITKLKDLPKHDFMTAGVPCQSWSIAGKNLGFDDDRGQLWNDTLFLLNKVRPKAFIFENVKGLADPRNTEALEYILSRIKEAGYYAEKYILNAYDYGIPQNRIRIYIIGFRKKKHFLKFKLPTPCPGKVRLADVLDGFTNVDKQISNNQRARWSLSCNEHGFNDYFLFNDLRNGDTTIHSWDIIPTTNREKEICYYLLKNRRKKDYGNLDGNPLSLKHLQKIDASITSTELSALVKKGIFKKVEYLYKITKQMCEITSEEEFILSLSESGFINYDHIKINREVKKRKIDIQTVLNRLKSKDKIKCVEIRYDFKNTKISTGLNGINRIFLPSAKIYPTLVASDTNDYVATVQLSSNNIETFRDRFLNEVFHPHNYRRITKSEACRIQGFPDNFILPENRARWMKLIGNSVAVNLIKMLADSVVQTGVFDESR